MQRAPLLLLIAAGIAQGCQIGSPTPTPTPSPTSPPPPPFDPTGLAVDASGTLFVSDCDANRVYRLDTSGLVAVVGVGTSGFAGDGGPAVAAEIACPVGLAFDNEGGMLVVDHANNRIRRVGPDGAITTVAGSGPTGLGKGSFGGDGGPAVDALLQEPTFISTSTADAIYFSDRDNDRVRVIDTSSLITTLVDSAETDDPAGIAIAADGTVFFSDSNNGRVRRVDLTGAISTVADSLGDPEGLALDEYGNLYVGDAVGNRLLRVDSDGRVITLVDSGLDIAESPVAMAFTSDGRLYLADDGNHCIRVVGRDGSVATFWCPGP